MQSSGSLRLRGQPAIPRGRVGSCRGTRALRDIEIIIATRFTDHYAVVYTAARTRRDELDDRAPQFRSHPNCTVAKIIIVTSMEVELVLIFEQDRYSKRRHERLISLFSLQSSCDSLLVRVQMSHASYSDMSGIGATCADKTRILSKANESSLGHSLTPGPRHGQRGVGCPVQVWASRHEKEHLGTARILRGRPAYATGAKSLGV
jgi:hypothetical protein